MKFKLDRCDTTHLLRGIVAFTLIELLVVIAVIGILFSLLMPALSRAKELSRTSVCSGNLRQQGIAYMSYASDNNGRFPQCGNEGYPYVDSSGQWGTEISSYVQGNMRLFFCPSNNTSNTLLSYYTQTQQVLGGAGMTYTYIYLGNITQWTFAQNSPLKDTNPSTWMLAQDLTIVEDVKYQNHLLRGMNSLYVGGNVSWTTNRETTPASLGGYTYYMPITWGQ